jgi:hypothetical protein
MPAIPPPITSTLFIKAIAVTYISPIAQESEASNKRKAIEFDDALKLLEGDNPSINY